MIERHPLQSETSLADLENIPDAPSRWRAWRNSMNCCSCKPTRRRAVGFFWTLLFYADVVSHWVVSINMFIKDGVDSNCWVPILLLVFLNLSALGCVLTALTLEQNRKLGLYSEHKWIKAGQITIDFLGFSLARQVSREWKEDFKLGICRMFVINKCCFTCLSFLVTTFVIATSPLNVSVPTDIWVCWCVSVGVIFLALEPDDGEIEWSKVLMVRIIFFLIGISTAFIYVFWWKNLGLYAVVLAWFILTCSIAGSSTSWALGVGCIVTTVIEFAVIQVYFIATKDFSTDTLIIAGFGTAVAVIILLMVYMIFGYFSVNMMFTILRGIFAGDWNEQG